MSSLSVTEYIGIIILSIIINMLIDKFKEWRRWRRERPNSFYNNTASTGRLTHQIPVNPRPTARPGNTGGRRTPPQLPVRPQLAERNTCGFPKCPIHKCRNREGQSQKIFWNSQRNMWRCYHGHYFSS